LHQIETLLKPIEKQTLPRTVLDRLQLVVRNGDFRPGRSPISA
jgi:hypothetical protein